MNKERGHHYPQEHTVPHLWGGAERSGISHRVPLPTWWLELQAEDLTQDLYRPLPPTPAPCAPPPHCHSPQRVVWGTVPAQCVTVPRCHSQPAPPPTSTALSRTFCLGLLPIITTLKKLFCVHASCFFQIFTVVNFYKMFHITS